MTQEYHRVINSYDDIEAQIAKNIRIKQLTERLLNLYEIRKMIFPQRQLLQNNLTSSKIKNSSSQINIKDSHVQLSRDFNSSTLDTSKELKLDQKKLIYQSNDQSSSSIITRFRKQIEQRKRLRNLSSCNDLLGYNPQEFKSQVKNQENQNKSQINLQNNTIHLRRNFYKTRSFTSFNSCQTLNQVKEQQQESNEQETTKTLTKKPRKYSIKYSCQTNDSPLKPTETSRISKDHETISVKDLFKKFNNNNIAYSIEERNESQIKTRRVIKRSSHKRNQTQDKIKDIQIQLI